MAGVGSCTDRSRCLPGLETIALGNKPLYPPCITFCWVPRSDKTVDFTRAGYFKYVVGSNGDFGEGESGASESFSVTHPSTHTLRACVSGELRPPAPGLPIVSPFYALLLVWLCDLFRQFRCSCCRSGPTHTHARSFSPPKNYRGSPPRSLCLCG